MFFFLKNLSSHTVYECAEPWANPPTALPADLETKDAYSKWSRALTTDSKFLSAFEGLTATTRVSYDSDNPPLKMHGLIVDYDAPTSVEKLRELLAAPQSEWLPAYGVVTFSGRGRLIWLFERPLLLATKDQAKRFIQLLSKQLSLRKWLAGFEPESLGNPAQYYHWGREWVALSPESRIQTSHLELWLYESGRDLVLDSKTTYDIPMEALAAEVEKAYPGRWDGSFDVGRRGVRFWDPSADNATAAIVRKDGMQCFTGNEPFVPWRRIFGSAFCERFEANKIEQVKSRVAWDGKTFWLMHSDRWVDFSREDFGQWLKVAGFDGAKPRGGTCSEIDRIEMDVKLTRRVSRALPFVHYKPGVIQYGKVQYLNTSCVRCLHPVDIGTVDGVRWAREHFPFIWELLRTMFSEPDGVDHYDQLSHFLGWLKHFYANALQYEPKPGQAVVIVGPPGKGKTFLSRRVISPLVGGWADASSFLVDDSQWTDTVIEAPVMAIDDSIMSSDTRAITRFSNKIKKVVANANVTYNAKFQKSGDVPWFGRVIITANADSESLRVLPDMDLNLRDKISLFKASDHKIAFPSWQETEAIVQRELPYFARWLLSWQIPETLLASEQRFGVLSFQHPDLYSESMQHGVAGIVLEILSRFVDSYKDTFKDKTKWSGSITELYTDLKNFSDAAMSDIKVQSLAISLGHLNKRGYPVRKVYDKERKLWIWELGFVLNNDVGTLMEDKSEATLGS